MTDKSAKGTGRAASPGYLLAQRVLGLICYGFFVLPYVRRILGLPGLAREHRIFVCNHVSLLDTILLGGIFWSRRRLPILVLGDAQVWQGTALRGMLSSKVGFLIERGKPDRDLIRRLRAFGASHEAFNLIVFPEGTRGDGVHVAECQPGIYSIAQAAQIPIVPVFISGMQRVSSKSVSFNPISGLRAITVEFGPEIPPDEYKALDRAAFSTRIQSALQSLGPYDEATRS